MAVRRPTPADVEQSDSEALKSEEDSSSSSPSLSIAIILAYEIFFVLRALKLLLVLVCMTFGTVVRSETQRSIIHFSH